MKQVSFRLILLFNLSIFVFPKASFGQLLLHEKYHVLYGDTIQKISISSGGTLWMIAGTNNSKIIKMTNQCESIDLTSLFGVNSKFTSICAIDNNSALVGTYANGLFLFNNGNIIHIGASYGIPSSYISSIVPNNNNTFDIGTLNNSFRGTSPDFIHYQIHQANKDSIVLYKPSFNYIDFTYTYYKNLTTHVFLFNYSTMYENWDNFHDINTVYIDNVYHPWGFQPIWFIGFDTCLRVQSSSTYYYLNGRSVNDITRYYNNKLIIATDSGLYTRLSGTQIDEIFLNIPGVNVNTIDTLGHEVFVGTNNGVICLDDTIDCGSYTSPDFSMQWDTSHAIPLTGDTIFFNIHSCESQFLWDYGDGGIDTVSNPFHIFNSSGTYSITLNTINDYCVDSVQHSIQIICFSNQNPILFNDTNLCSGDTITLIVDSTFTNCEWNNGTYLNQEIHVTDGGWFTLIAEDSLGCRVSDSIFINEISLPVVSLGNDIEICEGFPVVLQVDSMLNCLWSTGEVTDVITVDSSGIYKVEVYNNCFSVSDSILVFFIPKPDIELGTDKTITTNQVIVLDPGYGFLHYLWDDGSVNQTRTIDGSILGPSVNIYSLTVTDFNFCTDEDSVGVTIISAPSVPEVCNESEFEIKLIYENNILVISIPSIEEQFKSSYELIIYNTQGQIFINQEFEKLPLRINLEDIAKGIYMISIRIEKKEMIRKFHIY